MQRSCLCVEKSAVWCDMEVCTSDVSPFCVSTRPGDGGDRILEMVSELNTYTREPHDIREGGVHKMPIEMRASHVAWDPEKNGLLRCGMAPTKPQRFAYVLSACAAMLEGVKKDKLREIS